MSGYQTGRCVTEKFPWRILRTDEVRILDLDGVAAEIAELHVMEDLDIEENCIMWYCMGNVSAAKADVWLLS